MSWRPARSIETLLSQLDIMFPGRTKPDWIKGDASHAKRKSDHNPNSAGVVRAVDIRNGGDIDGDVVGDLLVAAKDDRVRYLIYNRRILFSRNVRSGKYRGYKAWEWGPYNLHPHDRHIHVSVGPSVGLYDDGSEWDLEGDIMFKDFLDGKTGHIVKIVKALLNEALGTKLDEKSGAVTPAMREAIVRWNSAFGFLPNDETLTVWAYQLLVGKVSLR